MVELDKKIGEFETDLKTQQKKLVTMKNSIDGLNTELTKIKSKSKK